MGKQRPLLSIGMIIKNEIRSLRECLDALAPLRKAMPCELVIADTGSTDGSRELAAEYADILIDFEWCDDFAAARNAVLERCSGRWHMQVDADEYLEADFSQLVHFCTGGDKGHNGAFVTMRNYYSGGTEGDDYSTSIPFRIFRTDLGFRFTGAIHEIPEPDFNKVKPRFAMLKRVVFRHDGYRRTAIESKQKRNLPLLEKELEKKPDDLRLALLCFDSSYTREQKYKYIQRSLELARNPKGLSNSDPFLHIAVYNSATTKTIDCNFPEFAEWVQEAKEKFPDSLLINLSTAYSYAIHLLHREDYEGCLREIDLYFAALERYHKGDYNERELQYTLLRGERESNVATAHMMRILSLVRLERYGELCEALGGMDFALVYKHNQSFHLHALNAVIKLHRKGYDEAQVLIKRLLEAVETAGDKQEYKKFIRNCRAAFGRPAQKQGGGAAAATSEPEDWRLFLCLGESCDLGRFANIMATRSRARAEILLLSIEAPEHMPPEVLEHALVLDAEIPENFFRMKSEDIAALASGLAGLLLDTPEEAMDYFTSIKYNDPGLKLWGYHGANEIVGRLNWKEKGFASLFEFYCNNVEEYLRLFHPEALCTDENAYALPTLARFAYYCLQARTALEEGDERAFAHRLREALATCPGMKNMISYLAENVDVLRARAQANPDMLMLAEQIRDALGKYPDDDPVKQMLLQSEEYRLLVHLIGR